MGRMVSSDTIRTTYPPAHRRSFTLAPTPLILMVEMTNTTKARVLTTQVVVVGAV